MNRISVIRDEKLVPLLPTMPHASRSLGAVEGLIVEKHNVGAIEIPEHVHSTFCLHLQTSGPMEMEWWSEGKYGKERTGQGSLVLLHPGTSDRLRWTRSSQRIVVSIEEAFIARAAADLHHTGTPGFENRWEFRDQQLKNILGEMAREMETGWSTGRLYSDLLAMSLSTALVRKYANGFISPPPIKGGMPKARLQRVCDYIESNCGRDLRLDEMAQVAEMSLFHFARLFRESTGTTPHQYLLNRRLHQAKALLRLGSRSIAEVAAETGFINASHFSSIFRKHTGVSPTIWKRRI